jgi:hypothetical protein
MLVAMLLSVVACGSEQSPANGRTSKSANGLYTLSYTTTPDPIPFSELFELDVTLQDAHSAPLSDATLALQVIMPAHGHGMQTSPQISSTGAGHYRVSGMKFHMHGEWNLNFTVQSSAGSDTVSFVEAFE